MVFLVTLIIVAIGLVKYIQSSNSDTDEREKTNPPPVHYSPRPVPYPRPQEADSSSPTGNILQNIDVILHSVEPNGIWTCQNCDTENADSVYICCVCEAKRRG